MVEGKKIKQEGYFSVGGLLGKILLKGLCLLVAISKQLDKELRMVIDNGVMNAYNYIYDF